MDVQQGVLLSTANVIKHQVKHDKIITNGGKWSLPIFTVQQIVQMSQKKARPMNTIHFSSFTPPVIFMLLSAANIIF